MLNLYQNGISKTKFLLKIGANKETNMQTKPNIPGTSHLDRGRLKCKGPYPQRIGRLFL